MAFVLVRFVLVVFLCFAWLSSSLFSNSLGIYPPAVGAKKLVAAGFSVSCLSCSDILFCVVIISCFGLFLGGCL